LLPGSSYVPRGKSSIDDIASTAASKGLSRIAVVCDRKGNPGKLELINVSRSSWEWGEPLFIRSVSSKPVKRAFTEIKIDEKLSEMFPVESDADAELSAEWKKEEITFAVNGDKLMIIKIGGNKNG
jgi:rRNA maturation protein Rpf1